MDRQIIYDILAGNDYTIQELGDIKVQDDITQSNTESENKKFTFSDYSEK